MNAPRNSTGSISIPVSSRNSRRRPSKRFLALLEEPARDVRMALARLDLPATDQHALIPHEQGLNGRCRVRPVLRAAPRAGEMAASARFEFVRAAWANPPAVKDSHRWSVKELPLPRRQPDVPGRSPGPKLARTRPLGAASTYLLLIAVCSNSALASSAIAGSSAVRRSISSSGSG